MWLCGVVAWYVVDGREQLARMDVDEPMATAVGGEFLPMIFVVSKAIEYIKNQILDRVVSQTTFTTPIAFSCRRISYWLLCVLGCR